MEFETAPTPGSALRRRLGTVLEAVLARVLALDPAARQALAPLEGRRIVLELSAPALALSLTVVDGGLRVGPARPQADLSLRAPLSALLARALGGGGSAGTGRIALSGDAELAQQLQRLVREFRPDLEAALGDAFGDVAGYQLARALAGALATARRSSGRFARDLADYLTQESRDLVGAAELEAFCEDVDVIRDDVERLDKRLQRLRAATPRGH